MENQYQMRQPDSAFKRGAQLQERITIQFEKSDESMFMRSIDHQNNIHKTVERLGMEQN